MEEQEKYLGGITSPYLGRGLKGCAIHVTSKRIIGDKVTMKRTILGTYIGKSSLFLHILSNPTKEEFDKEFNEVLKSKDFEIKKEEIKRIQLKRPGTVRSGHIKFILNSGEEIKIRLDSYPRRLKLFEVVGELMQSFSPEAIEVED